MCTSHGENQKSLNSLLIFNKKERERHCFLILLRTTNPIIEVTIKIITTAATIETLVQLVTIPLPLQVGHVELVSLMIVPVPLQSGQACSKGPTFTDPMIEGSNDKNRIAKAILRTRKIILPLPLLQNHLC